MILNAEQELRCRELWYAALAATVGIRLRTTNFEYLRAQLYSYRKQIDDPDLMILSIVPSPENPKDEMWILRKKITVIVEDLDATPEA